MGRLDGKTAIVTGAATGLGEGIALGYADVGAAVALIDCNLQAAKQVEQTIRNHGGNAVAFECDVSDYQMVQDVVKKIDASLGAVDILVNNAGIGMRAPAEEMSEQQWDRVISVNLKSTYNFCTLVGREMIAYGKEGRIINIASIAGLVGVETGNINYSASKGGAIAMSRCLAIEWAKYGILVNVIVPTHVRTPLVDKLITEKPETEIYFLNNIPLGRLGEVDDVVGPAIFLASPASRFMTGHVLIVDGGHTAK